MKKWLMTIAVVATSSVLAGCVIAPQEYEGHHHKQHADEITRDGVTLPDCATLPDASQADNGSRCWYR